MDKSEFELISNRNGFVIFINYEKITFPYYVFHPQFENTFIDSFESLQDAQGFCDEEDADAWKEDLLKGLV